MVLLDQRWEVLFLTTSLRLYLTLLTTSFIVLLITKKLPLSHLYRIILRLDIRKFMTISSPPLLFIFITIALSPLHILITNTPPLFTCYIPGMRAPYPVQILSTIASPPLRTLITNARPFQKIRILVIPHCIIANQYIQYISPYQRTTVTPTLNLFPLHYIRATSTHHQYITRPAQYSSIRDISTAYNLINMTFDEFAKTQFQIGRRVKKKQMPSLQSTIILETGKIRPTPHLVQVSDLPFNSTL